MKLLIIFLVTLFSVIGCQTESTREGAVSTKQVIDNSTTKEATAAYASISAIDFQNFTFPWTKTFGYGEKSFTLKNGNADLPDERNLSLRSLAYVGLTEDGNALVVVDINDGNAHYTMLYVYTLENGNPKVLESFEFGEEDNTHFATAFGAHDGLIIGRFIQKDNDPECCPSVIEFSYYTWQKNKFVQNAESQQIANPYLERRKKPQQ